VARGTQHRKRRPAQDARARAVAAQPRKRKQPEWQDELFFNRIRTHAKWAYVGLVLAFVIGFVLLGVGSGSNGLSDAFQNAFNFGSNGGTSISKLEKKVAKHPQDATAWRDLATAYEQKQRTQDAVTALERYTALRPKDADGYSELASQYTTLARNAATDYQNAQNDATLASPTTAFAPSGTSVFGKQAENTFKRLARLTPNDVTVQYQLGQAAQAASDFPAAIAAYKRFLKLAPNDVDAPSVRQLLKQVRAQAGITATTGGTG
jgi:cytochrome c-type biogenesis protein CcmH/NrfG